MLKDSVKYLVKFIFKSAASLKSNHLYLVNSTIRMQMTEIDIILNKVYLYIYKYVLLFIYNNWLG